MVSFLEKFAFYLNKLSNNLITSDFGLYDKRDIFKRLRKKKILRYAHDELKMFLI